MRNYKKFPCKSPRHDGFTKEYYEHFLDNLKVHFINSFKSVTQMCCNSKL